MLKLADKPSESHEIHFIAPTKDNESAVNFFRAMPHRILRIKDRRQSVNPFGAQGPWLTVGKMGGLILTERRKIPDANGEPARKRRYPISRPRCTFEAVRSWQHHQRKAVRCDDGLRRMCDQAGEQYTNINGAMA